MVEAAKEKLIQTNRENALILWFEEVGIKDVGLVGGKNASLGETIAQLQPDGINVPGGFAITAFAYRYFLESAQIGASLREIFAELDVDDLNNLRSRGRKARSLVLNTPFPETLKSAIAEAYQKLCEIYNKDDRDVDVAIRSSATAEDLPEASFAGQQETYLNVCGVKSVLESTHKCFCSPIALFPIGKITVSTNSK